MSDELLNLYAVLDLDSSATARDIREAYLDLVKVWHPDRFQDDSPRLRLKAEEKLKTINRAYEVLRSGASAFKTEQRQASRQPPSTENPELRPLDLGGIWGYADRDGKLVIRPRFEYAQPYCEGLALVRENGRCGYIDGSGDYAIYPEFAAARPFAEGLAGVVLSQLWGFIDRMGGFAVNPLFEDCGPFSEGLAAVLWRGRWGFVDHAGRFVIHPRYAGARPFRDGWAEVRLAQRWGKLNRSGEVYIEATSECLTG